MATLFRENGIDFDRVNYFKESFTEIDLSKLIAKTGLRPFDVLRKGEAAVKDAGITAETPDGDVIRLMVANPNAIQRPIVEIGDKAVLARPIEKALEII
ncbi:MAG: arsenate reductase [Pyrinomonadaceae bacterium]